MSEGFVDVFFTGTRSGLAVGAAARGGGFTIVGIEVGVAVATTGAATPASGGAAHAATVVVGAGGDGRLDAAGTSSVCIGGGDAPGWLEVARRFTPLVRMNSIPPNHPTKASASATGSARRGTKRSIRRLMRAQPRAALEPLRDGGELSIASGSGVRPSCATGWAKRPGRPAMGSVY